MHVTQPEGKAAAGADALHPTAFRGVLSCVRAPGGEFWSLMHGVLSFPIM